MREELKSQLPNLPRKEIYSGDRGMGGDWGQEGSSKGWLEHQSAGPSGCKSGVALPPVSWATLATHLLPVCQPLQQPACLIGLG